MLETPISQRVDDSSALPDLGYVRRTRLLAEFLFGFDIEPLQARAVKRRYELRMVRCSQDMLR